MKFIDAVKLASEASEDLVTVISPTHGRWMVRNYRCLNEKSRNDLEKFNSDSDDWELPQKITEVCVCKQIKKETNEK